MPVDLTRLRALKSEGGQIDEIQCDGAEILNIRSAYPKDEAHRAGDIELFVSLRHHHTQAFFDSASPDPEQVRSWVERHYDCDDHQINFIVESVQGKGFLFYGLSGIDPERRTAEFGRLMKAPDAPRGVAAIAIEKLFAWAYRMGLKTIHTEVFADNERSWRLMEKIGFRVEHTFTCVPADEDGRTVWRRGSDPQERPVLAMKLDLELFA